jgi:hypothetical protein
MTTGAIRIEGQAKRWCAFPCQAASMSCRVPIAPNRGPDGESFALLSGDGQPVTLGGTIACKLCGFLGSIRDGQIETITPGDPRRVETALAGHFGDGE